MPSENLHLELGPTARLIALPDRIPSATAQPSPGPVQIPEVINSGTSARLMVARSSGVASRTFGRGGAGSGVVVAHPATSSDTTARARTATGRMDLACAVPQLQTQKPLGFASHFGREYS